MSRYAVLDRLDAVYAIEKTYDAAAARADQAIDYLDEAEACGHSGALSWVRARRPLRVEEVSEERAREMCEDETPVLEREP